MQGRNAQVARLYRILNILDGAPQGLAAREIWVRLQERDFNVSKRTVYRDLEALSEAGFPLYPCEEGGDESATRWILEKGSRVTQYLALSSRELFALHLARGMLGSLKQTPLYSSLEQAFGKIEEKLGTAHRDHFAELSSEIRFASDQNCALGLDEDVLETVRAACAEGHVLSTDYESMNSGTKSRRRLGPHYVYFARGSVYLVAEELSLKVVKVFALPRMSNVRMEEESYEGKAIDHEAFFASSFGIYRGKEPVTVRVEFTRTVAGFVKERQWHPTQEVFALGDGKLELRMKVATTPELIQWILGFGCDAQVLEPQDLRVQMADSIAEMARFYR